MPAESVDLVYVDPPFNSRKNYSVFFGKGKDRAQNEAFQDTWTWQPKHVADYNKLIANKERLQTEKTLNTLRGLYKVLGQQGTFSYLLYMQPRLLAIRRLLRPKGSVYLHCDTTASHYLKIVLDSIFGTKCFRNEIVWHYTGGGRSKSVFSKKHDTIFWYSKTEAYTFNLEELRVPYKLSSGYAKSGIVSKAGKRYMPNPAGTPMDDVWDIPIINPMSKERLGYGTQKPLKLLERIVQASSCAGDVVLDPFCGGGTSLDAAESLKRCWIGIDISHLAIDFVKMRLEDRYQDHLRPFNIQGAPKDMGGAEELLRRTLATHFKQEPKTLEEAIELAERVGITGEKHGKNAGRFEFQRWACSLIDATPTDREIEDGGVDGKLRWLDGSAQNCFLYGAVEVKSTKKITLEQVRALRGVITNGSGYTCGLLISLYKNDMDGIAGICSTFTEPVWEHYTGHSYPRLQVWSIEEHFAGRPPNLPPPIRPYKQAELKKMKVKQTAY